MSTVAQRVIEFQSALEQAKSIEERLGIRTRYHQFVDQLSDDDKVLANQAAKPFIAKLVKLIKEEGDPVLQRANEMITRINSQTASQTI